MSIYLRIYLWGCLAGFIACISSVRDKDNRISFVELIVSIFCSSFSWVIALALFAGLLAKYRKEKKDKKDNNDKNFFDNNDIFGGNNFAGT
jgi:hypothetical protein